MASYNTPGGTVELTTQGAVFRGSRQIGWVLIGKPEDKFTAEVLDGPSKVLGSLREAVEFVSENA